MHAAQWTSIKPAERALEKLVRSYDLDPSRLLDACRETLAYDEPAAIAAALDAIAADGELVVVRVKNRLDPHPERIEHHHDDVGSVIVRSSVPDRIRRFYFSIKIVWTLAPPPPSSYMTPSTYTQ